MLIVSVCQEMKWDFYQYLNQPEWFVDLIIAKLEIDSKNIKKSLKK